MTAAKLDVRKADKPLYTAPKNAFFEIDVPPMQFVKADGAGPPGPDFPAYAAALEWLYSVSYPMKFAAKAALGRDYVVPPLEGLWWADDPSAFTSDRRDEWRWTMMVRVPDFVPEALFAEALEKARAKLGEPPATLRFEPYAARCASNPMRHAALRTLCRGPQPSGAPCRAVQSGRAAAGGPA